MKFIGIAFISLLLFGCAASKPNNKIAVTGTAENVKAGAIVISGDSTFFYIDKLHHWGDDTGRRVTVTGRLDSVRLAAVKAGDNPIIRQDFNRDRDIVLYYIKNAKWKFIDGE